MSIFGTILSKIFHGSEAQAAPAPQSAGSPSAGSPPSGPAGSAPAAAPAAAGGDPSSPGTAPGAAGVPSAPATPAGGAVDVGAVLDGLAAKNSQTLDWKHSIVDLMKLLDLDSSLAARKELAKELNYTGDTSDSATMNIWLHKQVMQKLAANGGKVPDDLKN